MLLRNYAVVLIIAFVSLNFSYLKAEQTIYYWTGSLEIMGQEVEFQLEIHREETGIKGYMSIPVQMMREHPVSNLRIENSRFSFELSGGGVTAYFDGVKEHDVVKGVLKQSGTEGRFYLELSEEKLKTDVEPLAGESEIFITTNYGNIYGSLLLPQKNEAVPLVLIVAGSGPTDRDGNNPMMGKGYIYRNLAVELQKNGIASLRFDKRGIGKSTVALIKEEDLRLQIFINDVSLWIKSLRENYEFSSIILLGHSEGSLLSIIAAQEQNVDALISVAGIGRTIDEVLYDQLSDQPEPYSSEGIKILESLQKGIMVREIKDELRSIFRPEIQPFLLSFMRFDPAEEIAKLEIPILILQGTTDLQVTVEDAEKLHKANQQSELKIIDQMNHVMRTSSGDAQKNFQTYGQPDLPFSDGFIESIVSFVRGN